MKLPNDVRSLGYTLVELMVVITIIAVLSASGMVVLSSVNKNNRDAARERDLNNIKQALELYFQANNNYPGSNISVQGIYTSVPTSASWIPGLVPTYFDTVPIDPNNNSSYFYTYQASSQPNGSGVCTNTMNYQYYFLYANLEGTSPTTPGTITGCNSLGSTFSQTMTSKMYYILSQ